MARKPKIMPGQLPLFAPESDWKPLPASQWPDFRGNAKMIGVDTETHDPNLQTKGPGFIRRDAKVCGVSLASYDGQQIYLPIAHPEDNVEDVDQALAYLKYQLEGEQVKCGANLTYELEALRSLGIDMKGKLADIQIAEPLLDEDRPEGYSLEALSQAYLGVGKEEDLLREAALAYSVDAKKGMSWIPARYVGPYAETDAYYPTQIFAMQEEALDGQDLLKIFELEQKLQRVLFKMRVRGVRIDVERAAMLSHKIQFDEDDPGSEVSLLKAIRQHFPRLGNPQSGPDVASVLKEAGIDVPRTKSTDRHPDGQDSIKNEWLNSLDHPGAKLIGTWRKTVKMRRDFIDKLVEDNVDGRIHSNWHQLRTQDEGDEAGGTRSGRIAATKFNLTQVPSRDPKWGPQIRSLFIADEGKEWVKDDYSQQEPRITVHFAYILKLEGAAAIRQKYIDDPDTDYHQGVADLVQEKAGIEIGRRPAKDINLGATYGMGLEKLLQKLGVPREEGMAILKAYHEGVPYVKKLEKICMDRAADKGFIITILGRRRRFPSWEPMERGSGFPIRGFENAQNAWPGVPLKRAMVHKALNALIQGSAADQMKKAIVDLDEVGLTPQIQVYDELNGSYDVDDRMLSTMKDIMEQAVPMSVPFLADPEVGTSWGTVKEPVYTYQKTR